MLLFRRSDSTPDPYGKYDIGPCYEALFIRRPRETGVGDDAVSAHEAPTAQFYLSPFWAKDEKFGRLIQCSIRDGCYVGRTGLAHGQGHCMLYDAHHQRGQA